jgi:hypothetical protein
VSFARLIRVWALKPKRGRCRRCRKRIVWVRDDRNRLHPFDPAATPIRTETDHRGAQFQIFEPTAHHRCPPKKRLSTKPQERLW